jgi:hypothetical protein
MSYREMARRLAVLERGARPLGEAGGPYIVDIAGDEPRYWIEDREVSQQEFDQRAPLIGPFIVELGDEVCDVLPRD